jgi:spoIIIJ-associated protein
MKEGAAMPETPESAPREAPEKVAAARRFCEGLLEHLGARVGVEVKETAESIGVALTPREDNAVELGGALVEAIQALVNRVANPRAEGRKWVNVEVGGFAEQGDPTLRAMAERLAATVRRTGRAVAIAPISPRDRRQIHLALQEAAGVSTRSDGEGIFRQLVILPDPGKKSLPPG